MSDYQLPEGSSSWNQLNADTVMDLREDPFWGLKQGTSLTNYAILIECGVGFLRRSANAGQTWVDITPPTNPDNVAGDAPSPAASTVTYQVIDGSRITPNTHGVMANWQNGSGEWRCWLYHTTDDFVSGSWLYLGEIPVCVNPGTPTDIPGPTNPNDPNWGPGQPNRQVVRVDTNRYVFVYRPGLSSETRIVACTVSGAAITWGTPETLDGGLFGGGGVICRVDTDKFAVVYYSTTPSPQLHQHPRVVIGTVSVRTITLGTDISLRTQREIDTVEQWSDIRLGHHIHLCSPSPNQLIIALAGNDADPGTCEVDDGVDAWYVIDAGISGLVPSIPTISCNGHTITDMTVISTEYSLADADLIPMGTTHWLFAWLTNSANNWEGRVVAGTGVSMGTALKFSRTDADPGEEEVNDGPRLANLNSTTAVVVWTGASLVGYPAVHGLFARVVNRSGSSVSLGTENTLWDAETSSESSPGATTAYRTQLAEISTTQIVVHFWRLVDNFFLPCSTAMTLTASAGVITVNDECNTFITDTGDVTTWLAGGSSSDVLFIISDNENQSRIFTLTDITTCQVVAEYQGLGLSYGRGIGGSAWATVGDGTIIELVNIDISPLAITARHNLGSATFAEIASKTWVAYPLIRWFNDDYVQIYGRMNNPQSLGSPSHLIYTTNAGGSFLLTEGGFGADHIGAMMEDGANDLYVIRNTGGSPQLYEGTITTSLSLTSTATLTSDVEPHGIDLDWLDLTVVLASGSADAILVVGAASPYSSWTDLTSDHGDASGNGLKSIEVL